MTIIQKQIMTIKHYDDTEVAILAPLPKMDIHKNLVSKDSNIAHPFLVNATDGFTHF